MPETAQVAELGGTSSGLDVRKVRMPSRILNAYDLSGHVYAIDEPWAALSLESDARGWHFIHPPQDDDVFPVITGSGLVGELRDLAPRLRGRLFPAVESVDPDEAIYATVLYAGLPLEGERAEAAGFQGQEHDSSMPPAHATTAAELRAMLDLPTELVAGICGVTRESYSRWVSGSPIRGTNLTRLQYLHALIAEARRRLGERFKVWLATPIDIAAESPTTPLELLEQGYFDRLHQLIVELEDPQPYDDETYLALERYTDDPDESWD